MTAGEKWPSISAFTISRDVLKIGESGFLDGIPNYEAIHLVRTALPLWI
jgi:hypothetical protein